MALLLAWVLVAATVLAGWTPAHADEGDDGTGSMEVQITDITPTVLRPGDDWVIRGTVTNTGTEKLTDPVLRLRFQTYVPSTRTALASWTASGDSLVTTVLLAQPLGTDLRPGQRHSYEITLTPEESPFYSGAAWGPRGIAIEATSGGVQDAQRTTVLWYPDEEQVTTPTELSVLLPLTATAQEWATASSEGTTLADAALDRLGPVLQAADNPQISWALDPALLETQGLGADATARALTEEDQPSEAATEEPDTPTGADTGSAGTGSPASSTPSGTHPTETTTDQGEPNAPEDAPSSTDEGAAPTTGADLISRLSTEAARRDVISLAYADADPATEDTQAGTQLAQAGRDRSNYLFEAHDIRPIDRVSWPSRYDLQSLQSIAGSGVSSVVLPADSAPPAAGITYTPSGRSQVSTDAGTLETALWDPGLSALFNSDMTPLQIRQDLLAQTAIIARERPSQARGLLAVAGNDIGADPQQLQAVLDALDAVDDAPWLQLANLRSLLGRTDTGEAREAPPAEPSTPPALGDAEVDQMAQVWSTLEAFTAVTDAPQRYLGTVGPNVLGTVSTTLATDPATQRQLLDAANQSAEALRGAVQVEPGSSVLLVSAAGDLPISIQSALPVAAKVTVRLVPEDPRLRAEEEVTATLRPNTTTTVRIPVTAVSNGNVDVHFEVLTPQQEVLLASGEPFSVRVRADWENTGTIIVAGLLVIGFIIGLIRTIRRGRPRTRAAVAAAAAGPAADPASAQSAEPSEQATERTAQATEPTDQSTDEDTP